MEAPKFVGARIKRREDPRLITGHATYVDDIQLPGMLYMAILRSEHAHARIKGIDASKATALPGVVAVFTAKDMPSPPTPPTSDQQGAANTASPPLLATATVRFIGEGVAVVVATDRYIAWDALELIRVDYEPLPAVVDPEKAMEPGAPVLHEQFADNVAYRWQMGSGDVDEAFANADFVIRQRMVNQRLVPSPMETRGVVAQYIPGADHLTVWASTQMPHSLRSGLASRLNLAENRVRVIAPEVGGGFGGKGMYVEEPLAALVAMKLGKPVKWIEERRENFVAASHGRSHVGYLEAAVKKDGKVIGLRLRIVADLGAYFHPSVAISPRITSLMQTGCYNIPASQIETIGVLTNKTRLAPYRGSGGPEASYYLERLMDLIARELSIDPAEVRRRNFIPPDAFPYTTPTNITYDTGNYEGALDRAVGMLNYQEIRREQERLRKEGRYLGIGFCSFVEMTGVGPSAIYSQGPNLGAWETATVRVEPSGKVTVLTGAPPQGQGHETTFAQMVGDELGVPIEDVTVLHGDTDQVQFGLGTYGSRALVVAGSALVLSMHKVKDKAIKIAAHAMEGQPQDMVYEEGRIYVRGFPEQAMTFREVVGMAYRAANLPRGMEPGLEATSYFDPPNFTFPFGTHICVVEVDVDSGEVKIIRYIAVDDCGHVINPMIVEGQIHGGIAQGVGQALLEGTVYDENGQLLTGSFMTYPMPTSTEIPMIETDKTVTPTPVNPLGAKGVGEAGTIAAAPAVVNAVVDALSPFGIKHIDMPLWPERVWRAIQEARGSAG